MNSKHIITTVLILFGFISFSQAQTSADDMVKDWERAKAYTKEYLDAMPADKYALKPTPEMRSFADQMLHLTDGNFGITAAAAGVQSPVGMGASEKSADKSKEAVTKQVMDSYDFVISTIKNMRPAQMSESVKLFDRFVLTRSAALAKVFEHQTHHRGQATVYIRLAGATPPQEKLF
jgi:uncharacterized damage-inducible protein DinB